MFWQNPSAKWQIRCQNFWGRDMLFDRFENGFKKRFDRHLADMKNMEILKAAKSYEKSSFSYEKLLFRWQPKKDSNPHKQSQSLSCYLYTIRLFTMPHCLATRIVYTGNGSASSFFFRKIKNVLCRKLSTGLEEIQASDPSAHRSFSKARFSMRDT